MGLAGGAGGPGKGSERRARIAAEVRRVGAAGGFGVIPDHNPPARVTHLRVRHADHADPRGVDTRRRARDIGHAIAALPLRVRRALEDLGVLEIAVQQAVVPVCGQGAVSGDAGVVGSPPVVRRSAGTAQRVILAGLRVGAGADAIAAVDLVVIGTVHRQSGADLFQIALAGGLAALFPGLGEDGEEDRGENGDDGDDDE